MKDEFVTLGDVKGADAVVNIVKRRTESKTPWHTRPPMLDYQNKRGNGGGVGLARLPKYTISTMFHNLESSAPDSSAFRQPRLHHALCTAQLMRG